MRIARVALVLGFGLQVHAQSGTDDLLNRAIAQVRDTIARLPDYLCTQTMDRMEYFRPQLKTEGCGWWPPRDQFRSSQGGRVRVDVLATASGEQYSWAGENQFQSRELLELVRIRTVSTGGFGGFLSSIFAETRTFSYVGEVVVSGRKLRQFSFRVPREKSEYWFGTDTARKIVACEGTFLIDPETAELVRLVVNSSEPPKLTGACHATTTLNYSRQRVNNSDFQLPTDAVFEFASTKGLEARNNWSYSGCHQFLGESTLLFDAPEPGPTVPAAKTTAHFAFALPEGLPFRIAFTQDVPFRTVAAGDVIAAKFATAIQDSSKHVLVPAGTPVKVRVLEVDFANRRGGSGDLGLMAHMIFRLESMTLPGTAYSFVSTTAQSVQDGEALDSGDVAAWLRDPNVGPLLLAPNTAILKFYPIEPNFVLKAGHQSKWRTGGTGPSPVCLTGTHPVQMKRRGLHDVFPGGYTLRLRMVHARPGRQSWHTCPPCWQ